MFKFLKRKKKSAPITGTLVPNPLVDMTGSRGGLSSMVTKRGPETVVAVDLEGGEWEFTRAGAVVYLQGDEGLVQVQFSVDTLEDLIDELEELLP